MQNVNIDTDATTHNPYSLYEMEAAHASAIVELDRVEQEWKQHAETAYAEHALTDEIIEAVHNAEGINDHIALDLAYIRVTVTEYGTGSSADDNVFWFDMYSIDISDCEGWNEFIRTPAELSKRVVKLHSMAVRGSDAMAALLGKLAKDAIISM